MVPALRDGDFVLVHSVPAARIRPGDVVVARHPGRADGLLVIKRAVRREDAGWWVLSDNEFVTSDSREFGAVPDERVLARAVLRLRDPLKIARIPAPETDPASARAEAGSVNSKVSRRR